VASTARPSRPPYNHQEVESVNEITTHIRTIEAGQAMVEYGLIVGLVAVACVLVLDAVGGDVLALFNQVPSFP
jgi:Flp pilus assembly pilin Flp